MRETIFRLGRERSRSVIAPFEARKSSHLRVTASINFHSTERTHAPPRVIFLMNSLEIDVVSTNWQPRHAGGSFERIPSRHSADSVFNSWRRHCERSEAIHLSTKRKTGLLRRFAPRNDSNDEPQAGLSWKDINPGYAASE
jgi:hypothetical protein